MGNSLSRGGVSRKTPLTIPTDTVVPVYRFDDTPLTRKVIIEFTMRFDDVLDAEKLRLSLEKLLSRRDWRKLGARLRLTHDRKLEYHIPEYFNEKRPAFAYSHVQHEMDISRHPTGSRLPRPTASPTVLSDPEEYAPLLRRWGAPKRLSDYLYTDAPQLSLHIVSFTDATVVSLSWPHTLLDAMGRRELLDAWIATLEGRDDDVKPLHGVLHDPLALLGTRPQEPYVLAHRRLSPWQALMFALAYLWTTLIWWRGEQTRMVCVPAAHIRSLHKGALDYLAAAQNENSGYSDSPEEKKTLPKPFVSEGDVLSAWISRLALLHLRHTNQTVSIMNAFGMRSVLSKDLLPPTHAYVGNAVAGVYAFLSMRDLFTRPLGFAAASVRRSIAEQGTRAQVEARAAVDLRKRGSIVYGDQDMAPIMISNWTKARFFDTDFSAAVIGDKEGGRVGKPSYIQPNGLVTGLPTRSSFPIVGKDAAGNYWFAGTLGRGLWDQVQEAMDLEYRFLAHQFENVDSKQQ